MKKHPIQPLEEIKGVLRFKENKIVSYLLNNGGIDLNKIAVLPFDKEDRVQFAQLIGYSLSGFGDLSYVSDDDWSAAAAMKDGKDERDARIEALENALSDVRNRMNQVISLASGWDVEDIDDIMDGRY